jgi:hypothetical protein
VITLFPIVVSAAASLISTGSIPSLSSPDFKVEYGYFMIPALDCPGGRCQQPQAKRLKVQSLDEQPVSVKDVIVNDRPECILANGIKKLDDEVWRCGLHLVALRTLKSPGRDAEG